MKFLFSMVFMKVINPALLVNQVSREVVLVVKVDETQDGAVLQAQTDMETHGHNVAEWQMIIANKFILPEVTPMGVERPKEDLTFKNSVMKKIIDEKNLDLVAGLKGLFSESENKYLREKINA